MLVVETLPNFFSSILLANIFLTYHHKQEIVQIFTRETHQPNLTYIHVVLKFKDFLWSSIAHLKVML